MTALPFEIPGVSITQALAKSAEGTFPVSNITEVTSSTGFHPLVFLGVIFGMCAFGTMLGGAGFLAFIAFAVAAGACFHLSSKWKTHNVNIATASGAGKKFFETRDPKLAQDVKQALETAISQRG